LLWEFGVADIFREIEEDLRADRAQELWRRYNKVFVGGLIAIVLGTAGYVAWQQHRRDVHGREGTTFATALALVQKGDPASAAAALTSLSAQAQSGYGILARLQAASIVAKQGKTDDALKQYDAIVGDASVDPAFRDFATVAAGYLRVDLEDPAQFLPRLQKLADPNSAWRYSATELLALADLKAGKTADARAGFTKLADDPLAPAGVRARAAELLASLGN
jgi:hypothetical protein